MQSKVKAPATTTTIARHFPGTDKLMHIAAIGPQSITRTSGKCQECLPWTGGGFYLCALLSDNITAIADLWRAQQGFFFISMQKKKSTLGKKRSVLFVYLTFFFQPNANLKDREKKEEKKTERNGETEGCRNCCELQLFCSLLLIKRGQIGLESVPPGMAHGRLPQT